MNASLIARIFISHRQHSPEFLSCKHLSLLWENLQAYQERIQRWRRGIFQFDGLCAECAACMLNFICTYSWSTSFYRCLKNYSINVSILCALLDNIGFNLVFLVGQETAFRPFRWLLQFNSTDNLHSDDFITFHMIEWFSLWLETTKFLLQKSGMIIAFDTIKKSM